MFKRVGTGVKKYKKMMREAIEERQGLYRSLRACGGRTSLDACPTGQANSSWLQASYGMELALGLTAADIDQISNEVKMEMETKKR